MAGHAQLKFVMTECSTTQIRLTGPILGVGEKAAKIGTISFLKSFYVLNYFLIQQEFPGVSNVVVFFIFE